MHLPLPSSHSTTVKLWLDCGQHGLIELERVAASAVMSKFRQVVPACNAVLIIDVDGQVLRRQVELVSGFSMESAEATVLAHDDVAPF